MENFIEKVATENAATIMAERMIDLLTNNTQIMDFVDNIGDIEVTTDFENGYVEVKTYSFVITYLVNQIAFVQFETYPYSKGELSTLCEILKYNEEVDNIFHSVMSKMTIREYFEKHKVDDVIGEAIDNYTAVFLPPSDEEEFYNLEDKLKKKDKVLYFYLIEDEDGDLFVEGNDGCHRTYFDDNMPMVEVYYRMIDIMNKEIEKIETEIKN